MDIKEITCGGVHCSKLSHDRVQWQALVNAVMNMRIPQRARNF
jgi:hypothetical protein